MKIDKTKQTKVAAYKPLNKTSYRISKWYKPDDVPCQLTRKRCHAHKKTALRKNIAPGQVLILLSGRFRGKRVVFLKQLESGLLLVTGPFKINGVPLRRVNQSLVIPTKLAVTLSKVPIEKVTEKMFLDNKNGKQIANKKKNADNFFASKPSEKQTEEQKQKNIERKKQNAALQNDVDKALIENIKQVEMLKKYLGARFSLTNGMKPHLMNF